MLLKPSCSSTSQDLHPGCHECSMVDFTLLMKFLLKSEKFILFTGKDSLSLFSKRQHGLNSISLPSFIVNTLSKALHLGINHTYRKLVGVQGFEPWTSSSQTMRTTGLFYTPNMYYNIDQRLCQLLTSLFKYS